MTQPARDWGEASEKYDEIRYNLAGRDLSEANEAQTRFNLIDRFIREVWGWRYEQISVEEFVDGAKAGYVDYLLRSGDSTIVVEAKKVGAAFPSPTRKSRLKLSGSLLGSGEIGAAITQAETYAASKSADVVIVTNGVCWCFFSTMERSADSYASLLFPVEQPKHAEELFRHFAAVTVERGSLLAITNRQAPHEDRLISAIKYADGRIDRNNIADSIMPALDSALYADALLNDPEQLAKCFVTTEARTKFDASLGIHLADTKPRLIESAKRIKTGQEHGLLEKLVEESTVGFAPPVTLIIGQVGAGKSTYLKHFELVAAKDLIASRDTHWIYIDFEAMGKAGNPRDFMYAQLLKYIEADRGPRTLDYKNAVEPAYDAEIRALARGPLARIFTNKEEFNKKVTDFIMADHHAVEPYVDKLLTHLATKQLCVVVLDNIDLYEDDALETLVFAEGLALSRRLHCQVIVSVRDTTFVRHRNDSVFNAYELRKMWLDPPPLKAVISSRLTYSRRILKGRSAKIELPNGMMLNVPDLSVFFEIVQRSILSGEAGDFVDSVADQNIRKGITLVRNFLTSGHIEADRALKTYLTEGNRSYVFPFHEIYKGTMLGQWRHFREQRADSINVFDSRLGSRRLRLLRLLLLNDMMVRAQREQTLEVPIRESVRLFSALGASENQVLEAIRFVAMNGLLRNVTAEDIDLDSSIVLTRSGGYYAKFLVMKFVYVEECMFDTAIEDSDVWQRLYDLTIGIDAEQYAASRMEQRRDRIQSFLQYLEGLEDEALTLMPGHRHLAAMKAIREAVLVDVNDAVTRAHRYDRRLPRSLV